MRPAASSSITPTGEWRRIAFIIRRSRSRASTSSSWPSRTAAWPASTAESRRVSAAPDVIRATSNPANLPSTWIGMAKASCGAPSRSSSARRRRPPAVDVRARSSWALSVTGTFGETSPSSDRRTSSPSSRSHSSPCEPARARLTRRAISERARSGSVGVSSVKAATASSVRIRPRVSATSRAFSMATAAWRAKSRAAALGSATSVEAWTAPIAPTRRSPYQSGIRFHAKS